MPHWRQPLRLALTMGLTWCAIGRIASAQLPGLAVDPHVVVLSPRHPTGKVIVFNPKATATEYSVRLSYGWITTDSTGAPRVHLDDASPDSTHPHAESAAHWITPYPTKFILNPGASQTVRLLAKPPRTLPDGEYWARLILQSRELVPPFTPRTDADSADSGVRIGLSIETSTLIPLFYRTGITTTGISIDSLTTHHRNDSLIVTASLRRLGNAAYIGAAQLSLTNESATQITTLRKRIAVYQTLTPRWTIPLPKDTTTTHTHYTLTLSLSTDRPDIPANTVIRAPTVTRMLEVVPP